MSAAAADSMPAAPGASSAGAPSSATFIGAIDQGTSSTRFILFDRRGGIVGVANRELSQKHTEGQPGWAEHDPLEILDTIDQCIRDVLAQTGITRGQIVGVGITNQRETTVAWDRTTGQPLHNALVWHDTRTADLVVSMAERYRESGGKDHFRASCGLPISTYFSALKICWLMQHVPSVQAAIDDGRCCIGTIDSWIIWNLSGGARSEAAGTAVHVTDVTNASRTMLMDLKTRQWSEENCKSVKQKDSGDDSGMPALSLKIE